MIFEFDELEAGKGKRIFRVDVFLDLVVSIGVELHCF